jgi:transcriptional regulator with XRE-family HTH domain
LTQEQLAERIGVSVGAISQLETGRVSYTQAMLEALADALGCDPADLLIRNPTDPDGIWSIWDRAAQAERREIVDIAKIVVSRRNMN